MEDTHELTFGTPLAEPAGTDCCLRRLGRRPLRRDARRGAGREDARIRRERPGGFLEVRPRRHREGGRRARELPGRVLHPRRDVCGSAEEDPRGPARQGYRRCRDQPGEPG